MRLIRSALKSLLLVKEPPERIALAFSVGIFFGFSPFLGLHTMLGLLVAVLMRLNKTAVLVGVYMNNPWLIPPFYAFSTWLGVKLTGVPEGVSLPDLGFTDLFKAEFWSWLAAQWPLLIPAFVGSMLLSILLALFSYPGSLMLLRRYSAGLPALSSKGDEPGTLEG